jgi:2-keto-4-pentenoate hydratase/2-oxohepta-3-ene-1,7-dioic acid hydratase in catechol pathway
MRLVTFEMEGVQKVGIIDVEKGIIVDLKNASIHMGKGKHFPSTMLELIEGGNSVYEEAIEIAEWAFQNRNEDYSYNISEKEIKLNAPIPRPNKNIFCVGKNYAAHAIEMGSEADIPTAPIVFSKAPTTVTGPDMPVMLHENVTKELDYEGEIAVVIGKKGTSVQKEEAFDYIFGYTLLNDVTARDLQRKHKQYLLGKSLDTSCPMGPYITHKSMIEDPNNLQLTTRVNGEVRQAANTEQFIFDIATIIHTVSQGITLEPGDIIATGTPAGVGKGFNPPKFLQRGDVVEVEVSGLGVLRNQIS